MLIDLSKGRSPLLQHLGQDHPSREVGTSSVVHFVLPELSIPVVSDLDPGGLADHIIDSLWHVFSSVRLQCEKAKSSASQPKFLIWAWPGETTGRPDEPTNASAVEPTADHLLSMLPALSGLLRCMALELGLSIVLLVTDSEPQPEEINDVTSFLAQGTIPIGDLTLSQHRLSSFEPRLVVESVPSGDLKNLEGHILSLGGARGIVAEMLLNLVSDQSHLSVVGRTQLVEPDPELMGLTSQELMRKLMQRHRQSGTTEVITPRALQEEAKNFDRQCALSEQLSRLRDSVRRFDYHSVDLVKPQEFQNLLDQHSNSDVGVLINGAGVIQDQSCLTKQRESFDAVMRTKVMPLCVLLCRGLPLNLKTWISFSSIASKSGNPGQADYAAANELLNTVVHLFARQRPDITIRTINWGPWAGSGMATAQVLKAFHDRGLEAIEPEDAYGLIQQVLQKSCSSVECSAVALSPSVMQRLMQQQSLSEKSALWRYHSLPVADALASPHCKLLFHHAIPYLQGHRKNGQGVVPAALFMCLAADAACSVGSQREITIDLYVFNGITVPDFHSVSVLAQVDHHASDLSGQLMFLHEKSKRPYYKVSWSPVQKSDPLMRWNFTPHGDPKEMLHCVQDDIYSACLFHSGVMARLIDRVVIDPSSQSSWCRATPSLLTSQLGVDIEYTFDQDRPKYDLTLVDALLQLLLVQTIETQGFSALPQELSMKFFGSMPLNGEVLLTITIVKIEGVCLEAIGACADTNGNLIFEMNQSKFTVSKDLLDYPPGIIRQLEAASSV